MAAASTTLDQARVALRDSPISALRDLVVEQAGESLVISGSVTSFYQKQLAQEAVRAVCRDIELLNTVAVGRETN
jgi:hypothetical protein